MSSAAAPLSGAIFSEQYELTGLIARGGMGDVYQATDGLLGRQVAVKVFRDDALADRSRFDTEVRTLAALSHPGLVQVFDAGEHSGHSYVVLEFIDGPSLRSVLTDRNRLSSTEVAVLGESVISALAYVHGEGVVHRDVTPANILCGSDGRHRLADFGIARLLDTSRVTAAATTLDTAAYMAPDAAPCSRQFKTPSKPVGSSTTTMATDGRPRSDRHTTPDTEPLGDICDEGEDGGAHWAVHDNLRR